MWRLGCLATSTEGIKDRNIISTIQFGARGEGEKEERCRRNDCIKERGDSKGSQGDRRSAEGRGGQRPGKILGSER